MTAEPNRIHLLTVAYVDTTTTLLRTIILTKILQVCLSHPQQSQTHYTMLYASNNIETTSAGVIPMTAGLLSHFALGVSNFLPFSSGLTNYSMKDISCGILTHPSCDNLDLLNQRWTWDSQGKCFAHAGIKEIRAETVLCGCLPKPTYVHEFICMLDIFLR